MTRLIDADTLIERLKFKRRLNGNIPDKCAGYAHCVKRRCAFPAAEQKPRATTARTPLPKYT